ncbi:uncharacterized protein LOC125237110 isoform X2 [Leguminivora glycinivorella]|uniref:uncharacterized protein LOC125237110 isoform X2 n=1 Tax=Leguminivora glycinivorella TaxID=1035111 RepID=UPI00200BBE49|nr:uncharacterized protein LOC125237110 isoform X2 [Leguminivora glycinivorella]
MDSDEDLTVSCAMYLAEWGLSETTISNFEENKISVKLLDCIEEAELKELIPSLKERILYKRGMKKLQTIIHETCSDDTVSINSSDDTVSINSDFSAPSPTNSTTSTSINKLPPTKENSSYETYYIPAIKYSNKYRPAKGKLIDRYNNQRRLLKREGVICRKRKLEFENTDQELEIAVDEETLIWLQYNKEPFQEVKDKWLQTRQYRMETDYKNAKHNLQDILKKYPLLKQSFGFQLIELDFEYSHPKRGISLFLQFPQFLKKVNDTFIRVKVFQDLKNLFNNTEKEDTKVFIALSLLCGKLVPTVGRFDAGNKDKDEKRSSKAEKTKYNKPTILESRDSLILHVKTQGDIQNRLTTRRDIQLKKGLTCQPVVICVGPDVENLTEFYVNFDDVTYQLESLLKAVDICFKTFHVFDIQYPHESIQPWMFIQHYMYDIKTPQDHKFPSVATLIADLM